MPEPYHKHYLAEVPQELRLRVLACCARRRWEEALAFLHAAGFPHEWYELTWFYWHAPTELEPRSADSLSAAIQPSAESASTPGSKRQTPNCDSPNSKPETPNLPLALTPVLELQGSAVKAKAVKPRKPRSKVARLPAEIQFHLNVLLRNGSSYAQAIHWLSGQGYSGFNKVNINNWRTSKFQRAAAEHELKTETL